MIKRAAGLMACLLLAGAAPVPQRMAVVAWLQHNAVPIATDDPAAPDTDLARIDAMIGDARIVGAGEATHGTREFFRLKDRLFRHLVARRGFTGFAIEANYADAEAIDAWVKGGPGDPDRLIATLGFWTWDTEEVRDLIVWMRAWNASHARKLSFRGVDIQYAPPNLAIALDYLDGIGTDTAAWRSQLAPYLRAATSIGAGYKATNGYSAEQMAALRGVTAAIVRAVEASPAGAARERARGAAIAAAWYFVMQSNPADWRFTAFRSEYDVRDRAMADLAAAALRREGDGGRIFLWAHNMHIGRSREYQGRMTMGHYLQEDGAPYLAIGMTFGSGAFQAYPTRAATPPGKTPSLTEFRIAPPRPGSPEAILRQGPGPIWIADLRRLTPGTPAHGWFATPQPVWWAGADYSAEQTASHPPTTLTVAYDLLLYVDRTTRARPLAATRAREGVAKTW